ncbi:pyridoxal-phosphate dependent enzyme [bacterium]|nr:pyridoxal-phosphate dependent enzyme [bacterium]
MTVTADPPRTATADLALVRRFPAIHRGLRRHPLCALPTPVAPLERLARARGLGPLWIKRDDASCALYGGNKPRKLEWLLGAAVARGRRAVMTFGGIGTHHGLATAICAHDAGLRTVLVLLPQPVTAHVRRCLLLHHAFGCEMHLAESVPGVAAIALRRLAQGVRQREPLAVIPTGGTSALGSIGYVNAACELADQVRAGLLPEPAAIFVAVGSGGTLAGLQLGLRLAGLRSTLVGVLVTDILPPSPRRLASLARGAFRRLRRVAPSLPRTPIRPAEIVIERAYVGDGYGAVSDAGVAAQRLLADSEGIALETTYTAKTMAAMLDLAARPPYRDRPLLFWNTYSSVDPGAALPRLPDWRELPPAFHRFFA